nr:unnamed protein product [Digitaria exilis]
MLRWMSMEEVVVDEAAPVPMRIRPWRKLLLTKQLAAAADEGACADGERPAVLGICLGKMCRHRCVRDSRSARGRIAIPRIQKGGERLGVPF